MYACFVIGFAGWIACAFLAARALIPPRPSKPKLIAVACEGCGCVWESYNGHRDRIKQCPNCPMSEEEFEALKESVRNRKERK
jgi:hypothetical protein